ncbi:MAG: DUF4386 family protein [Thermoleophilaceae bacterium]|nr:DUF4386 family protein [Thermoleophilaceae bacterium]
MDKKWLAPLAGVAFPVLVVVGFVVGGEPPDVSDDSPAEIIAFYVDNEGASFFSGMLEGLAATLLVFFAGALRRALRDAEGGRGILSAVAFAGLVIVAVGLAIDATITMTLAETAEDLDPAAAQALSALYENDYMPMAVGSQLFLLATGLSVIRHGALPKWIGWVAIVLGVIAVTPIGFVGAIGAALLVAIIGGMLAMRWRGESDAAPPAAAV